MRIIIVIVNNDRAMSSSLLHKGAELSQADVLFEIKGGLLMAYKIDARLERGAPSLTLIDAVTGEVRLHWRGDRLANGERDWLGLFKRLTLLSCTDQLSLVQHATPSAVSITCIDEDKRIKIQVPVFSIDKEGAEC